MVSRPVSNNYGWPVRPCCFCIYYEAVSFYVHRPLKTLSYIEALFFADVAPAPLYSSLCSLESLLDLDLSFRRNWGENNIKNGEINIC